MKIAQIVASIESMASGPSHSVPGLCDGLARQGGDVELLSLGNPGSDERDGYRVRRFSYGLGGNRLARRLGFSPALKRFLRTNEYDILHGHGLWMLPNAYPAVPAVKRGVPLLLSPRGMLGAAALAFSPRIKAVAQKLWQDAALRETTCFHATSHAEYEDIRQFGLTAPVAIIPNAVYLPDLLESRRPTRSYVLSLGRIHAKKGLDRLVKAWAVIEQDVPSVELVIAGPDEKGHSAELRSLVAELNLSSVAIRGPVFGREKTQLMSDALLFVLPTLHENFAMTVAESLAVRTPVISTKGAPWRGLDDNKCGWWIDHGVEPLASAMKAALTNHRAELEAMGERGREWMRRDFSWPEIGRQMMSVYCWLLGKADAPDQVTFD